MTVRVLAPGRAPLKPRARRCDNLPHGHERRYSPTVLDK